MPECVQGTLLAVVLMLSAIWIGISSLMRNLAIESTSLTTAVQIGAGANVSAFKTLPLLTNNNNGGFRQLAASRGPIVGEESREVTSSSGMWPAQLR